MAKFDDFKKQEILQGLTNKEKDTIVLKYFEIAGQLKGVDPE